MGPFVLRRDSSRRRDQRGSRSRSRNGGSSSGRSANGSSTSGGGAAPADGFTLYVEGARDREILALWARRAAPAVTRCIERNTVILGGRRPARAVADFQRRGGVAAGHRGLVVLDRDHHEAPAAGGADGGVERPVELAEEPGLELFVWGQRHIESYLLVPSAIRRVLDLAEDDQRVEQVLAYQREVEGLAGRNGGGRPGEVHAKRILGARGSLTEVLGAELRAGDIARTMRADELHQDVHQLLARIRHLSGLADEGPEVVVRTPRPRS